MQAALKKTIIPRAVDNSSNIDTHTSYNYFFLLKMIVES